MRLVERIVRLYAPYTCIGCGVEEDRLLCDGCRDSSPEVVSRCYRCKAVTEGYSVCDSCRRYTPLRHVYVARPYEGLTKDLLHMTKYERAKSGLEEVAELMAPLLRFVKEGAYLVSVPTATTRVRQRGYDQSLVLSLALSRRSGLTKRVFLRRLGQAHQVGSTRRERLAHLDNAFRVIRQTEVKDAHVVLVDDVLTTGATLETAARELKKAGATQVDAIVFAQPS